MNVAYLVGRGGHDCRKTDISPLSVVVTLLHSSPPSVSPVKVYYLTRNLKNLAAALLAKCVRRPPIERAWHGHTFIDLDYGSGEGWQVHEIPFPDHISVREDGLEICLLKYLRA